MTLSGPGPQRIGGLNSRPQRPNRRGLATPGQVRVLPSGPVQDNRNFSNQFGQIDQQLRLTTNQIQQNAQARSNFFSGLLRTGGQVFQEFRAERSSQITGQLLSNPEIQKSLSEGDPAVQGYLRWLTPQDKQSVGLAIMRPLATQALEEFQAGVVASNNLSGGGLLPLDEEERGLKVAEEYAQLEKTPAYESVTALAAQFPNAAATVIPSFQSAVSQTKARALQARFEAGVLNSKNAEAQSIVEDALTVVRQLDQLTQTAGTDAEVARIADANDDELYAPIAARIIAMVDNPVNGGAQGVASILQRTIFNKQAGYEQRYRASLAGGARPGVTDELFTAEKEISTLLSALSTADKRRAKGSPSVLDAVVGDNGSTLRVYLEGRMAQLRELSGQAEQRKYDKVAKDAYVDAFQKGEAVYGQILPILQRMAADPEIELPELTNTLRAISGAAQLGQSRINKARASQQDQNYYNALTAIDELSEQQIRQGLFNQQFTPDQGLRLIDAMQRQGVSRIKRMQPEIEQFIQDNGVFQEMARQLSAANPLASIDPEGTNKELQAQLTVITGVVTEKLMTLLEAGEIEGKPFTVDQLLSDGTVNNIVNETIQERYAALRNRKEAETPNTLETKFRETVHQVHQSFRNNYGFNKETLRVYAKPFYNEILRRQNAGETIDLQTMENLWVDYVQGMKPNGKDLLFPDYESTYKQLIQDSKGGPVPEPRGPFRNVANGAGKTGIPRLSRRGVRQFLGQANAGLDISSGVRKVLGGIANGLNAAGIRPDQIALVAPAAAGTLGSAPGADPTTEVVDLPTKQFERPVLQLAGVAPEALESVTLQNSEPENMRRMAQITTGKELLTATTPPIPQAPADAPVSAVSLAVTSPNHPYSLAATYARQYRRGNSGVPDYVPAPFGEIEGGGFGGVLNPEAPQFLRFHGEQLAQMGEQLKSPVNMEKDANQGGFDIYWESKQVPALMPGVVKDIGREPGYGIYTVIETRDPETGDVFDVLIGHLADTPYVRIGQSVNSATVIGRQGGTGTVQSIDGTIASYDFLEPEPQGSKKQKPYKHHKRIRKYLADGLEGRLPKGNTRNAAYNQLSPNARKFMRFTSELESDYRNVTNPNPAMSGNASGYIQATPIFIEDAEQLGIPNARSRLLSNSPQAALSAGYEWIQKRKPEAARAIESGDFAAAERLLNTTWTSFKGGAEETSSVRRNRALAFLR